MTTWVAWDDETALREFDRFMDLRGHEDQGHFCDRDHREVTFHLVDGGARTTLCNQPDDLHHILVQVLEKWPWLAERVPLVCIVCMEQYAVGRYGR